MHAIMSTLQLLVKVTHGTHIWKNHYAKQIVQSAPHNRDNFKYREKNSLTLKLF